MGASQVQGGTGGHYAALGVPVGASAQAIERAFHHWRERRSAGTTADDEFLRAEGAYIILSDPRLRARHDTQLGLRLHPVWSVGKERTARRLCQSALQHLARGRSREARELLARAVALAPEFPQARSYFGLVLMRTGGSLHEAARHGEYAVGRQPEEPAFLFNLSEVYAAAGLQARSFRMRVRGWAAVGIRLLPRLGVNLSPKAPKCWRARNRLRSKARKS